MTTSHEYIPSRQTFPRYDRTFGGSIAVNGCLLLSRLAVILACLGGSLFVTLSAVRGDEDDQNLRAYFQLGEVDMAYVMSPFALDAKFEAVNEVMHVIHLADRDTEGAGENFNGGRTR